MLVYLAYCFPTDKVYVGQTVYSLQRRWRKHLRDAQAGSKFHFHNAIRKYGPQAFEIQVLTTASTLDDLNHLEKLWISALRSSERQFGYNMTLGGNEMVFSGDVRRRGWKWNSKARARKSLQMTGTKQSPETVQKRVEKIRGTHWTWDEEARKRHSFACTGRKGPWAGKIRPETTRRKISSTLKQRKAS